ncbi:Bug family tripartite tricarboxylate transporter substrate binding protein [Rhodoplanes azumiensis]|uniref:Bug family tripartite tricarboxylate transporter substrate binding protein n=1 Tax=Rhodoplanes azumiensis TaxID=1897628 RepID=A0ABW5AGU4_9BRAD
MIVKLLAAMLVATAPTLAIAQPPSETSALATEAYPSRPLRFVVPFPPGGTLDVLARTISHELSASLGQTVVVENRPGASGMLGAELVARAAPDGHTLMIGSNTLATLPALRANMPIDIWRDLAPVVALGSTPTLITVHPSFPARDFAQFVDAVKKSSGGASYNSPGIASPPHLAGELLARAVDIPLVHVPYRGTQPAVTDLAAGHIPIMMAPLNAVIGFVNDKKLVPIAVTDARRTRYLPEVPTLRELGVAAMPPVTSWFGIYTTGGTPPAVIARLNAEIARIMRLDHVAGALEAQTFEIATGTPDEMAAALRTEALHNARIVAEANIRVSN